MIDVWHMEQKRIPMAITCIVNSSEDARPFDFFGSKTFELLSATESRLLTASDSRLLMSRSRRVFWPFNRFISFSANAFSPYRCENRQPIFERPFKLGRKTQSWKFRVFHNKTSSLVFSWMTLLSLNSVSFNLTFVFSISFLKLSFSLAREHDDRHDISFSKFWIWERNSSFSSSCSLEIDCSKWRCQTGTLADMECIFDNA